MILFFFSISLSTPEWCGEEISLNPSSWGMELLMEESSLGACAVIYSSPLPSSYAAQTWRDCPSFSAGRRGKWKRGT